MSKINQEGERVFEPHPAATKSKTRGQGSQAAEGAEAPAATGRAGDGGESRASWGTREEKHPSGPSARGRRAEWRR